MDLSRPSVICLKKIQEIKPSENEVNLNNQEQTTTAPTMEKIPNDDAEPLEDGKTIEIENDNSKK